MEDVKIWSVDPAHSKVQFSVKHMVISEVTGEFKKYDLKIDNPDDNLETAKVEFTIDPASIDTGIEDRNNHLKSPDFFDVEKFSEIKFESTGIKKVDDENYKITGNLKIRDITNPIELNAEFGGQIIDPWGNIRAGYKIEGSLDRFDYGLTWNNLIETGGAVVGRKVKISCNIEIVKPQPETVE